MVEGEAVVVCKPVEVVELFCGLTQNPYSHTFCYKQKQESIEHVYGKLNLKKLNFKSATKTSVLKWHYAQFSLQNLDCWTVPAIYFKRLP